MIHVLITENKHNFLCLSVHINKGKKILFLISLLFVCSNASSQYTTPTINASISNNEYGVHTDGFNQNSNGGVITYMTWDATNLYLAVSNSNVSEAIILYLDKDPQVPVNGGANSNGTNIGFAYDGTSYSELPFRADLVIYAKNGYREYRTANGANNWSGPTSNFGTYADGSNIQELSIPWSVIGGIPSSFNFFSHKSFNGGIYNQQPTQNPTGEIGTTARNQRYYTVTSTENTTATAPFSRNSYVFNAADNNNSFGAISVWDFTMNTSGRQISRVSGDWTIGGTLVVGNGTVFFGSVGPYGSSNVGNINVLSGGSLNMDQTDKSLNVSGNLTNTGTITLSAQIGGDISVQGNITDNGIFNSNNRAIFFSGNNLQNIQGSGVFDISYVRINKTGGSVRMLSNLTCQGPTGGNAMELNSATSILDLNGFTLNLGQTNVGSTYNIGVTTPGFIRGSNTSSISILGTGALGTINFETGNQTIGSFIVNRPSGSVTLGTPLQVTNTLTIANSSTLNIGANTLTISASVNNSVDGIIAGTGSIVKTGAGTLTLNAVNGNITANTYTGGTTISAAGSGTINVSGLTNITSTAITRDTQTVTFSSPTPANGNYRLFFGALIVNTQSFSHNANATKVVTLNYNTGIINVKDPVILTQTITPTTYCAGGTVSVNYEFTGTYSGTFTAELSNASGSFASPVVIGSGSSPITATIPSGTPAGTGYRIRVVNNNPIVTGTDNAVNITINAIPSAPAITGSSTFCQGSSTELSSSAVSGNQWYKEGVLINGATASTLSVTTAGTYTVVATVSGCSSTPSTGFTVSAGTQTIWNGTGWSNGNPDSTKPARFEANATIGADFNACSLTVANNAVVTVSSGYDVTLNGPLTVSSGSFTLENNASLIQNTTENNSGNITVKRNSSSLMRQDYTLWSSPVASQNLYGFSPQTLTNRFYTYNQASNVYSNNDMYQSGPLSSTSTFQVGRGYLIRMPNNHPTTPTTWTGQFIGVPNNGNINVPLTRTPDVIGPPAVSYGYNLVGNPYPSPIIVDAFLNQNLSLISPTLWFWRKTNGAQGSAYITLVAGLNSGGTAVLGEGSESNDTYIQQGQGFFVKAIAAGDLQFTNQQRLGIVDTFYRTNVTTNTSPAIGRVWLHLKSNDIVVGSMAIGYREGATNELDTDFDGKYINDSPLALTSFVQGEELSVQHRAVPFTATDIVPLSFKTDVAGTYAIAINAFDGLFSNGQSIYLRDNQAGTIHNLNDAPYSFASAVGNFASRFEIVYQSALDVSAPSFNATQVILYQNTEKDIVVNTGNIVMNSIKVFDIRGRLIEEKKGINATQTTINATMDNQVLLVQITSQNGLVVTKKIIL